jgi:L-ascorbate peroxidase
MPGGMPWTKNWLQFDNSYFMRPVYSPIGSADAEDLLWLPTDQALHESPEFKTYFFHYAADQSLFFKDYADAHKKMSELGAVFDPPEGIFLPDVE